MVTGWDPYANGPEITDLTPEQVALIEQAHDYVREALAGARVAFVGAEDWSDQMRGYAERVRSAPAPQLTWAAL